MSKPASAAKPVSRAPETVHPAVLGKLITFAVLMAVVPIGTYFGSLNYIWEGSTTFSAISAIVAANLILVGYVVLAFKEDLGDDKKPVGEKKNI
ncbi:hypothetical protein L202_06112 [Cryptococcus amylolentus CBS 6039]|uniref:Uncharacterized protein n=2 Tax=Cryptococcus amylolentus TaxID=104669 RepID=A0A1E3HL66_9TREE|nr:hypothetical protein L202_06112 [Cryptococcus amylolentus CBS 6039]ODN76191.1 hypothetical protein L202_06112 [Cryptococcus amylolentus CBS 6039]ODN96325.1 hypothetical protein I350_08349 [Cryptococcus amylolentus CBS 6273]